MPLKTIELDQSVRDEDVTLLIGKNIVIKLVENERVKRLLTEPMVRNLLEVDDLCHKEFVDRMRSAIGFDEEIKKILAYPTFYLDDAFVVWSTYVSQLQPCIQAASEKERDTGRKKVRCYPSWIISIKRWLR